MIKHALEYASRGWAVFPLLPNDKRPLPGSRGCLDGTIDEQTIRDWWSKTPDANIGLACGIGENAIYVVDIDPRNGGDLDMYLPDTLQVTTPGGGKHAYFHSKIEINNKQNIRPGVDIRGRGGYVVLPPSIHPNGGEYAFSNELPIADYPPSLMPERKDKPAPPWLKVTRPTPTPQKTDKTKPKSSVSTPPLTTNPALDLERRAEAYLSHCEPAVQGQAGHDRLLWAAQCLVGGFKLDDGTAIRLLWEVYNPRCSPPWDRSKPADVKDFERKVREARKHPVKEDGWLLGESSTDELLRIGAQMAGQLLDQPTEAPTVEIVLDQEEQISLEPELKLQEYDSLRPPGLIGEILDWVNDTAGCPQPLLALGTVLTAFGAVVGRKVRDMSNGRTNLYMMGVAHSSAGKDHPSDCMQQLITAAGGDMMLGSRVTSDSAIEVALLESPVKLFIIDEVGHFFSNIKGSGGTTGGNSHLRSIVPMLMELYSSAHKLYVGKQRADAEARRIMQPHVCVWGNTAPDVFFSGISRAELRDGWLGRVVTLISNDRPKYEIQTHVPPPKVLIERLSHWVQRKPELSEDMGDIESIVAPGQVLVDTDQEAMNIFNAFRDEAWKKMLACDKDDDDSQYLWGKALQQARSIALTIAAGCDFDTPVITGAIAKWSVDFIRTSIVNFAVAIKYNVAESEYEGVKQRIWKLVHDKRMNGMSKVELTRKTQFIKDRRTRDEYIADLIEAGKLMIGIHKNHPNHRSGWLWAGRYIKDAQIIREIKDASTNADDGKQ